VIGKATKRESPPSPLGALLPITFQFPLLRKENINNSPIHLTFFQKLRKCVNERVGYICILYTRIAVKGRTVVRCIGESINLLYVYFFILVFCKVKIPILLYSGLPGAAITTQICSNLSFCIVI
jgi:hypothetical protein